MSQTSASPILNIRKLTHVCSLLSVLCVGTYSAYATAPSPDVQLKQETTDSDTTITDAVSDIDSTPSSASLGSANSATTTVASSIPTQLPSPIIDAMQEIGLDRTNLSLVITPLQGSHLPEIQVNQALETLQKKEPSQRTLQKIEQLTTTINSPALPPLLASQYQGNLPRTPASTMKLIPTFVALDTLGKDFIWATNVYHTGIRINDRLYGDLIIKGSGDPKLTQQKVKNLLYQVQQTGIRHIEGDIILDSSIFHNVGKDPAKFDGEPLRPYNASPDGLLMNFNTITLDSYPLDNGKNQLLYTPKLADIDMPSHIGTRSERCYSNVALSLAPVWHTARLSYRKALPKKCQRHTFYIAYPKPKSFAQHLVKQQWQEINNTLSGEVRDGSDSRQLSPKLTKLSYFTNQHISPYPIATAISYPLSQQIHDINHHSNNVMTEQLTLSISSYQDKQHFGQNTNYPKALATIDNWWTTNLSTKPPHMTNGSGLCRECTVTANNLNELLNKAYQHPDFDSYVNSLGVAGVSGTIVTHKNRKPDSAAIGRAWIKTGTLGNVTAMAGYVKGKSGQEYSVVGIINLDKGVRNANHYRPVLDEMINWVAKH